jgi:hypothetical protein
MVQRSPLVTLAATAVGLVALLVVNSTQTTTAGPTPTGEATTPAATSPATTPPATTPPVTTPASPPPSPTATKPSATPSNDVEAVYAGRTNAREATVAVAVKGGRAAAYVCDGRRVEAWLTGTQTAGRVTLQSRGGDRLVATVGGRTVTGTITVHGRSHRFTISKADPPAGLYRARTKSNGASATIGWIVLADGSQVGIENDGTPAPAPRLDPSSGAATIDGVAVTASSVTGDETF